MLKESIDNFYRKRQKVRERTAFYVTDVASCPRAVFFDFKKFPRKEQEPRVARIMHNGDFVHQRLVEALQSEGVLKPENVEVNMPFNELVRGRADALIDINGERYVVDFKSMNSFKFKQITAPEDDHVKQVQMYMHFFALKHALLVYECKNTQDVKEFLVVYDEQLVNECLAELYKLRSQINQNMLPDVPVRVEQWRCEYCPFLEECKKLGNPFFPKDSSPD